MKAIYLLDSFPEVSETFVSNEIAWMEDHGHLKMVVALRVNDSLMSLDIAKKINNKIHHGDVGYVGRSRRPFIGIHWLLRSPLRFLFIYNLARSSGTRGQQQFWKAAALGAKILLKDVQVIHVHFASEAAQIGRYLSLLCRKPYTFCTHGYDIFFKSPSNYPELAQDAASLVTISNYNRKFLVERYGVPESKITVIHCGVDVNYFQRQPSDKSITSRRLQLLAVGRLEPVKGHKYLIEACEILKRKGFNFELEIVGDGSLRCKLQEQVNSLNLTNEVVMLGALSTKDVREHLKYADIFLMPSISESMGVATMEAMAMEVPIVATRVRGVPELVENGISGILVDPQDAEQLAHAIIRITRDHELAKRLAVSGRIKVCEEFNAHAEYGKLVKLWRDAINR